MAQREIDSTLFPSPFALRTTRLGGTLTIAVDGELDAVNAPMLQAEILAAAIDCGHLVIDLTDVAFMDSIGMSVLLTAKKISQAQGFNLFVIPSEHDQVARVFELTDAAKAFM